MRRIYKYPLSLMIVLCIALNSFGALLKDNVVKQETDKAFKLFELVQSENKFIEKMDSFNLVNLPVGIASKDKNKNEKYAIIISDIIIRNGQSFLNAYMAFTIPGTTKKLAFKGSNIPFSFSGGIKGEAKLELLSDVEVNLSNKFTLKLNGSGATYVSFDCNGFKEMAIDANLEFDSTLFVPENPDGSQKAGKLSTSFKTKVSDWNDLLISISVEPFQMRPLKGVGFTINKAVFDFSDFANADSIEFPENYKTDYFADGNENIWRGLYIESAEVRLPKYFKKKNAKAAEKSDTSKKDPEKDSRLKLYAHGLFIDELGFTAEVGATNILSLEAGDMKGWGFSLDTLNFVIESSQLISANFSGQIKVKEFKGKNTFNYAAQIGLNDSYAFNVSVADSLEMNLWMAKLTLEPNSAFNIELKNGNFVPTLDLNGIITINAPTDKKKPNDNKLALAEIPFQGMHITTEDPYFSIDYISFGTKQNLFSKFPISINELEVAFNKGRLGLQLGLIVNFTGEKAGSFGGEGGFTVWAKHNENGWEYDGIDIDKIVVNVKKPGAFELEGTVLFIDGDSIYGNGFKGQLKAKFANFGMEATALFGTVNSYRYWYADALVSIGTGIPAGPLSIYGFGGGAYYNMKQTGVSSQQSSNIGKSSSGVVYAPQNAGTLGIMATVKLGLSGAQNSFNGDAKFEIVFNSSGGINQIYFTGNGYFITNNFSCSTSDIVNNAKAITGKESTAAIPKDNNKSQMNGNIKMTYDFTNTSFHTTLDLYVNAAGGTIKGSGTNGKAGTGVIHIDPSDWYIKLGTPQSPNSLTIAGFATLTNYFVAGKKMPEMPLPPANVTKVLGDKLKSYYAQRNETLPDGTGFALGINYRYNTGEKNYWIFFANFDCSVGFDLLIKNYGAQSYCSGSAAPLGINGWYAQGQAYGWISSYVGVNVNIWFYHGRYTLFNMETAALLSAKAPNPVWAMGNAAGNYSILGGWVRGSFNFNFELGKQCQIIAKS